MPAKTRGFQHIGRGEYNPESILIKDICGWSTSERESSANMGKRRTQSLSRICVDQSVRDEMDRNHDARVTNRGKEERKKAELIKQQEERE